MNIWYGTFYTKDLDLDNIDLKKFLSDLTIISFINKEINDIRNYLYNTYSIPISSKKSVKKRFKECYCTYIDEPTGIIVDDDEDNCITFEIIMHNHLTFKKSNVYKVYPESHNSSKGYNVLIDKEFFSYFDDINVRFDKDLFEYIENCFKTGNWCGSIYDVLPILDKKIITHLANKYKCNNDINKLLEYILTNNSHWAGNIYSFVKYDHEAFIIKCSEKEEHLIDRYNIVVINRDPNPDIVYVFFYN